MCSPEVMAQISMSTDQVSSGTTTPSTPLPSSSSTARAGAGYEAANAAGGALSVAGTLLSSSAKNKAAEQGQLAAEQDLYNKYNAVQAREQQEMQRAQLETLGAQQSGRSNASRIRAQAASGGVSGSTIAAREAQPDIEATNFGATVKINLAHELRANQLDAQSYRAQAQSVINEEQSQKVSAGAEALDVLGDVAKTAEAAAGAG